MRERLRSLCKASLIALVVPLASCAGGAPMMHPASVLRPGFMSMGAGLSGQLVTRAVDARPPAPNTPSPKTLQNIAVSPGIAPWVSGRVGIRGGNEGGLTYTGRSVRVDGRHAFGSESGALSIGVGASLVLPERPGSKAETEGVYGGGFDVPILVGVASRGDLYAVWAGPRAGYEVLGGQLAAPTPGTDSAIDVEHFQAGAVVGGRAGFRYVHAAIEVSAAYHRATGRVGASEKTTLEQFAVTPAAALILSF